MQIPRKMVISIRNFRKSTRNSQIAKPYFAPYKYINEKNAFSVKLLKI